MRLAGNRYTRVRHYNNSALLVRLQEVDASWITPQMQSILEESELATGDKENAASGQKKGTAPGAVTSLLDTCLESICTAYLEWNRSQGNTRAYKSVPHLRHMLLDARSTVEEVLSYILADADEC